MSLRSLEAAILLEAKKVVKNSKLRQKDILEWTTGDIKPREGEKVYYLPEMGVHIAIEDASNDSRKTREG